MQRLQGKTLLLVGFTLFSMFFEPEPIFPPYLGAQAGVHFWFAFAGFAVRAVLLRCWGSLPQPRLAGCRSWQAGSTLYLHRSLPCWSTCPSVHVWPSPAQPAPPLKCSAPCWAAAAACSWLTPPYFFWQPSSSPCSRSVLLRAWDGCCVRRCSYSVLVLFSGCLLDPIAPHYAPAVGNYQALPAAQGMLDGYQTMDALAGLNFGAVLALNIRALGVTEEKEVQRGARRAGFITAGLLLAVYGMLGHIGALTGYAYPQCSTGAQTLTVLAQALFGHSGRICWPPSS